MIVSGLIEIVLALFVVIIATCAPAIVALMIHYLIVWPFLKITGWGK